MGKLIKFAALALVALAMSAVAGDSSAEDGDGIVIIRAELNGANAVPTVTTDAYGVFLGQLNASRTKLEFILNVRKMEGAVMAHVHCGPLDEAGPVVAFIHGQGMQPGEELFFPPPAGPIVGAGVNVNGVLSFGELSERNMNGATPCGTSFEAFVEALLSGEAYVDVHSVPYMKSEIRGQTEVYAEAAGPELQAFLAGEAEVPPVETDATVFASAFLNAARNQMMFVLANLSTIEGVTEAHIHCGLPGGNGPVAAYLFGEGMAPGDELPSPPPSGLLPAPGVTIASAAVISYGVLTDDNLTGAEPCATFDALVEAVLSGKAYVNIYTMNYENGEVRGQIGAVPTLHEGWNFVSWNIPVCVPAENAFRRLVLEGVLNVVWTFDGEGQRFDRSYASGVPYGLNTLMQVCPDDVLIVNVRGDTEWIQAMSHF